jgi:hypothetical protein
MTTSEKRQPVGGAADLRCTCGSLMARQTTTGIELKCRRCKRIVVLPLPAGGRWVEVRHR